MENNRQDDHSRATAGAGARVNKGVYGSIETQNGTSSSSPSQQLQPMSPLKRCGQLTENGSGPLIKYRAALLLLQGSIRRGQGGCRWLSFLFPISHWLCAFIQPPPLLLHLLLIIHGPFVAIPILSGLFAGSSFIPRSVRSYLSGGWSIGAEGVPHRWGDEPEPDGGSISETTHPVDQRQRRNRMLMWCSQNRTGNGSYWWSGLAVNGVFSTTLYLYMRGCCLMAALESGWFGMGGGIRRDCNMAMCGE